MGGITLVSEMCELSADVRAHFKRVCFLKKFVIINIPNVLDGAQSCENPEEPSNDRILT